MDPHQKVSGGSNIRSTTAQAIIVAIVNMVILQYGIAVMFPVIVVGQLLTFSDSDKSQSLSLNPTQASWFSSTGYIFSLIGSLVSALVQDRFGRKTCFTASCLPLVLGWYILHVASSSIHLYLQSMLIGFATGMSGAAVATYVGEITEPRLRNALSSLANLYMMFGILLTAILYSFLTWKQLAAVFLWHSLITLIIFIVLIPESPVWLVYRGNTIKAINSLHWVRGFQNFAIIESELNHIHKYVENIKFQTSMTDSIKEKLKLFEDSGTKSTFILFNVIQFFCEIIAMVPVKPYLLNVAEVFGMPIPQKYVLMCFATCVVTGSFINIIIVKLVKKRKVVLTCGLISLMTQFFIGIYGSTFKIMLNDPWIPFTLFCVESLSSGMGVLPIPWILLSELFPMKSRGAASSISNTIKYIYGFIFTKTYLQLAGIFTFSGIIMIYSLIGCAGIVFMYFKFPETENKTLLQIQQDFGTHNEHQGTA